MSKSTIGSFIVSLESELAQVGEKSKRGATHTRELNSEAYPLLHTTFVETEPNIKKPRRGAELGPTEGHIKEGEQRTGKGVVHLDRLPHTLEICLYCCSVGKATSGGPATLDG